MADVTAMLAAAMAAHQRGALAEAEEGYRAALRELPAHPHANYLLALTAYQTGRMSLAEEHVVRCRAAGAVPAEVYRLQGAVLQELGKYREAIAAFVELFYRDRATLEGQAAAFVRDFDPTNRRKY